MNLRSLSPILLFILLFLGSGLYFTLTGAEMAFYKVSAVVCIMPALFLVILLDKGGWEERTTALCKGFANPGIAGMLFIFFLAGGFAAVTKGVGCVQEAVLVTKAYLPDSAILCGAFVVASLISMSLGTSMGVIGVLGPFVVEMAQGDAQAVLWLIGAIVGGAAFGDNLSLVSDTSIAASQTVGVSARDKFLANARIALISAAVVVIFYLLSSALQWAPALKQTTISESVVWWKLLPYPLIITLALLGCPVVLALFGTTLFAALLGILFSDYSLVALASDFKNGIFDMTEVAILSFCLGGLQAFVVRHGGASTIERRYATPKKAVGVIAKMSTLTDVIFANNTVSILFVGSAVKNIAQKNNLSLPFAASLMDIFATATQCLIPHGAQLLLASSLAQCSPIALMPYCIYSFALYICSIAYASRCKNVVMAS